MKWIYIHDILLGKDEEATRLPKDGWKSSWTWMKKHLYLPKVKIYSMRAHSYVMGRCGEVGCVWWEEFVVVMLHGVVMCGDRVVLCLMSCRGRCDELSYIWGIIFMCGKASCHESYVRCDELSLMESSIWNCFVRGMVFCVAWWVDMFVVWWIVIVWCEFSCVRSCRVVCLNVVSSGHLQMYEWVVSIMGCHHL